MYVMQTPSHSGIQENMFKTNYQYRSLLAWQSLYTSSVIHCPIKNQSKHYIAKTQVINGIDTALLIIAAGILSLIAVSIN